MSTTIQQSIFVHLIGLLFVCLLNRDFYCEPFSYKSSGFRSPEVNIRNQDVSMRKPDTPIRDTNVADRTNPMVPRRSRFHENNVQESIEPIDRPKSYTYRKYRPFTRNEAIERLINRRPAIETYFRVPSTSVDIREHRRRHRPMTIRTWRMNPNHPNYNIGLPYTSDRQSRVDKFNKRFNHLNNDGGVHRVFERELPLKSLQNDQISISDQDIDQNIGKSRKEDDNDNRFIGNNVKKNVCADGIGGMTTPSAQESCDNQAMAATEATLDVEIEPFYQTFFSSPQWQQQQPAYNMLPVAPFPGLGFQEINPYMQFGVNPFFNRYISQGNETMTTKMVTSTVSPRKIITSTTVAPTRTTEISKWVGYNEILPTTPKSNCRTGCDKDKDVPKVSKGGNANFHVHFRKLMPRPPPPPMPRRIARPKQTCNKCKDDRTGINRLLRLLQEVINADAVSQSRNSNKCQKTSTCIKRNVNNNEAARNDSWTSIATVNDYDDQTSTSTMMSTSLESTMITPPSTNLPKEVNGIRNYMFFMMPKIESSNDADTTMKSKSTLTSMDQENINDVIESYENLLSNYSNDLLREYLLGRSIERPTTLTSITGIHNEESTITNTLSMNQTDVPNTIPDIALTTNHSDDRLWSQVSELDSNKKRNWGHPVFV